MIFPQQFVLLVNALRRNSAEELAALSGGEYFSFSSRRNFEEKLAAISNQIHNYYLLSFQPPPGPIMKFHSLRVTVPDYPKAVIQTRKSYWSGIYDAPPGNPQ